MAFFDALSKMLTGAGIDIRTFYCPMSPDSKIEHIYAPDIDTFFTTGNQYHTITGNESTAVIDLNQYVRIKDCLLYTS